MKAYDKDVDGQKLELEQAPVSILVPCQPCVGLIFKVSADLLHAKHAEVEQETRSQTRPTREAS